MNIYMLFGGMTVFVCAILYSVITRIFYLPHVIPKSRGSYTRVQRKKRNVWIESAIVIATNTFHRLSETVISAQGTLYSVTARIFRKSDDLPEGQRSPAKGKAKKHKAQPHPSRSTKISRNDSFAKALSLSSSASSESSTAMRTSSPVPLPYPTTERNRLQVSTHKSRLQELVELVA